MKIYISFILSLFTLFTQVQSVTGAERINGARLFDIVITTKDNTPITAEVVQAPEGSMGATAINNDKVPAQLQLIENANIIYDSKEYVKDVSGMCINITGNTSSVNTLTPRYKIKFEKKTDLLDRNNTIYKDKEWRLMPLRDIKTIAGYWLSQQIGMEWTPAYDFCNLYINDKFLGVYIVLETVKRNTDCRLNVNKNNGYIVERDPYWWVEDVYFETSLYENAKSYRWTYKYPDDEDVTDEITKRIQEYINRMEATILSSQENEAKYEKYLHTKSAADWLLVHDILGSYDSGGSNIYFSLNDISTDSLLHMPVLWDFDSSFDVNANAFARIHTSSNGYFKYLFNSPNKTFTTAYKSEWVNKGKTIAGNLGSFLCSFASSELAAKLQASLNLFASENSIQTFNISEAVSTTNDWLTKHLPWIDSAISEMEGETKEEEDNRVKLYDRLTDTYLKTVPETEFDGSKGYTYLPMVHLQGDFGYDYANGTVSVYMPDDKDSQPSLKARIKWRGGTTNAEGKHKRNYKVKFISEDGSKDDRKFFGLRKDNNWIIEACQVDMSRVRNRVATDLWNDFATKPYYYDKEPKALTGTRGQFVELFLNDEYRGIYCMTECIDRSQMKLKKYEEADAAVGRDNPVLHGMLWKAKGYENAFPWLAPSPFDNTSGMWGGIELEYPEIDEVCPTDWSTLYNAVSFVSDVKHSAKNGATAEEVIASRERFCNNVAKYIDLPVIIDYYVLFTTLQAIDNDNGKNIYWACYDTQSSPMLTPAVWDLDCTIGGYFDHTIPAPLTSVWPYRVATSSCNLFYSLDKFNAEGFHDRMVERYRSLRSGVLSNDNLKKRYTDYMDMLTRSGAYGRDSERWSGDSDIGGKTLDYDAERERMLNWIDERLAFLDANIDDTPEHHYSLGIPVMEIYPDKPSYPENPIGNEEMKAPFDINYDNGLSPLTSLSNVTMTRNAATDVWQITLAADADLTRDGINIASSWQLYPESAAIKGMPIKVFTTGHYRGQYILTTDSYISGITDIRHQSNSSPATYTLFGTKAGRGYKGIVVRGGKKVMM